GIFQRGNVPADVRALTTYVGRGKKHRFDAIKVVLGNHAFHQNGTHHAAPSYKPYSHETVSSRESLVASKTLPKLCDQQRRFGQGGRRICTYSTQVRRRLHLPSLPWTPCDSLPNGYPRCANRCRALPQLPARCDLPRRRSRGNNAASWQRRGWSPAGWQCPAPQYREPNRGRVRTDRNRCRSVKPKAACRWNR